MNTRVLTWALYDLGNTFLQTAIGGIYLAQWIIIDNNFHDIWYGGTFSVATIIILVLSPFLGSWSDRIGKRFIFIKYLTFGLYFANILLVIFINSNMPSDSKVYTVLFLFLLLQIFYQLSLIFHSALIKNISTDSTRGNVAGIGEAANNFGQLFGYVLLLPFANGTITLLGDSGRSQVFLPALILMVVFTLPFINIYKEKETITRKKSVDKNVYLETINGIKDLFKNEKNVGMFLLGFSLVSDAVLTAQLYFAIAMERLYGINDNQKVMLLALMTPIMALGSYAFGKLCDRIGGKKVLMISCMSIILSLSIAFGFSTFWILYLVIFLAAIGWGGFYTSSKIWLISISPQNNLGKYFGLYSTFQRFASIIGPTLWGLMILVLGSLGNLKYRIAGYTLILIMLFGILILRKVSYTRTVAE